MGMTFGLDGVGDTEDDIETANDLIDEINLLLEEMPEDAEDFAESVSEKASDISAYIQKHGRVTKKQNMLDGLQRWVRD